MTMIGQLLTERYLVLKVLGAGGFSETYVARDKYLPHHPLCVVKYLKLSSDNVISADTARQLFETEARILDRLGRHHSQIPTLFAHCHAPDPAYQVQEYIDGENVGDWIQQKRRLTAQEAIALLLSVLPVLDYIHSHQVIHRDIKPSNLIRRTTDERIVLIDFGAACLMTDAHNSAIADAELLAIGTAGYMPEEQKQGQAQFNSDLYALGMTVIHLLTGVHPSQFHIDPISGEVDWQCHLTEALDPSLAAILSRMVQRHSRDRYPRAADALNALYRLTVAKTGLRLLLWQCRENIHRLWKPMLAATLGLGVLWGGYHLIQSPFWRSLQVHFRPQSPPSHLSVHLLRDLPITVPIDQLVVAPNNRILVTTAADDHLYLWSLPNGARLKTLSGHRASITALAVSADSQFLVSGGSDRTLRLWDVTSGQLLWQAQGNRPDKGQTDGQRDGRETITAIAISPDGRTIASGSEDGTIQLWDRATGMPGPTLALPHARITALAYGTSSNQLMSASQIDAGVSQPLYQLQVWDVANGQPTRNFAGHTAPIERLQMVAPDTLISVGQDRAIVWNVEREELVQVCEEDRGPLVTGFVQAQSPTPAMLTVHDDGSIQHWTWGAGHLMAGGAVQLQSYQDVAISPDLNLLVGWSQRRLQVWQMDTSIRQ